MNSESLGKLRAYFKGEGQPFTGNQSMASDYASRQAYPDTLQIGSIVFGCLDSVVPGFEKHREERPLLVYGLWKEEGQLKKLEVMKLTSASDEKKYPWDFALDTPNLMMAFHARKQSRINCGQLYIIDNTTANFPRAGNALRTDAHFWPELLVRRAHDLSYHPNHAIFGTENMSPSMVREGFIFEDIWSQNIRQQDPSKIFDIAESDFERVSTSILPQPVVNQIASFSVAYYEQNRKRNSTFQFPPLKDWNLNIPAAEFPVWNAEGRRLHLPRQPSP